MNKTSHLLILWSYMWYEKKRGECLAIVKSSYGHHGEGVWVMVGDDISRRGRYYLQWYHMSVMAPQITDKSNVYKKKLLQFHFTAPWGESVGDWWIPSERASDAESISMPWITVFAWKVRFPRKMTVVSICDFLSHWKPAMDAIPSSVMSSNHWPL